MEGLLHQLLSSIWSWDKLVGRPQGNGFLSSFPLQTFDVTSCQSSLQGFELKKAS